MKLPDDFDIDSLPVIGEGAAQTPQAQAAPSATGQSQQQPSADFDIDSLPELPRIPTAEEKRAQFEKWKRRRDAAQAAVPEERRPGARSFLGDVARGMFTTEGTREAAEDSWTAKPYAYMNDLANSIVSGFLGGGAKIEEAAGRIVGDNAVGRALVSDAQAGQAKLERALPTNALDTSGGGVANKVLNVGKGVAHVTGEFAPAAIPGVGQAYAATTVSAGSVNRYGQVKEAAKANGYSDAQAEAWATGAGALDALQNILLMKGFRGIWGGGQKAAADAAKRSLVKKLMVDTVKTGGIMGGGGMAQDVVNQNVGIDQQGLPADVRPYDWKRTAKVGVDQFLEGGMFHLVNTAAHAMPRVLAWESAPRTMSARLAREALDTPEGRALVMSNNPEAAKKILEARKGGKDVSRRMLEELGIPSEVAPSKGDRNALADAVAEDYRAWKDWQKTLPDKQQSAALDAEIAGVGADGESASLIREGVLSRVKDAKELDDPKRRADLVYEAANGLLGDITGIGGNRLVPMDKPVDKAMQERFAAQDKESARTQNEAAREAKRTAKAEEAADAARAEQERLQAEAEQEAAIKERAEQEAMPNSAVEEMKAAEAEAQKQEANPHQARLDAWPEYSAWLKKNGMKNKAKNWNKFVAQNDLDPGMKVETPDQAKKRGAKEFERGLAPDEELAAFDEYSKYVQGEEYKSGMSNLSFDEWLAQRRDGAKNGPTIAPRAEGTTTPPNGAEPPQGGKSAENATAGRSVSADTIGGEPPAPTAPPSTPAPEPKKPFGTGDSSHGTGKYSRKNYDSDSANTGATGAATWHWQNGERVYSLPVDFSQTRPGGPVVLDKTDSAYERINELLNGRQLVMTKSGKIQFKGEFKGAVPKELRELLGRELKIGKNPDAPSKDDLYGVNKGQFGEETRTTWEEVEKAVAADRENYHNWQKRQQRADRRASEEKKLEKKVKSGKATQNELDILRHRNMMEDYLDQGGKETDADYKAMERDLEVLQESGTYDYEGLSKAKDAADRFRDAEWENAIGDIESGEGDFSPSDQYVKPFTRENLQGAKKGDIIHFDHDEVKYELDRYDPETGVMDVYRSDENGVKRRFKVSRNGVEEIRNDGKGQKGVVQDNAGDAGGGGRPAPGAAGGEARGAEGAAGRGSGAGGAEARKPADLTTKSATPEQRATWTDRGGTTHVLEGFAAPSSDNVAKGAHVAVRHDNGVLYQGEIVGIGPKNVKVKTDGGMYGGETVLTFPRKDIVGVMGQTGETREARQEEALSRRLQDQKFKDWAKKHGVTPTKDHLEMYDREQAKGAFAVAKRWIRGIKAKFESRPPTDADLGANDRAIRNVRGDIIGKWDKATGEVTFYPGANAETVAHEIGWHATYDHAEKLAAQGDRRLLDKLNAYARGAQQATWTKTITRYGMASDPRMIIDEVGAARFTAEQAMKIKNEVDRRAALKWYGKAWEACRDAYKSMLTKMGFNKTSVDALNGMSPERAVEFMATEMARGKTLAKVEAKKVPGVNDALTAKEKYVRAAKDSMHVLKWVDEVTGGRFHLHRDQKLSHGMKQKAFDRAMQFWNEMATECKAAGIKLTELDEYIRAKGAADTNRRIKALNGNENGAGISDVDAARTVLQYERGAKGAAMKSIAKKLWDLQHEGLMERVNAGLVDAQFAADLEANEPFHVPRHNRFDANGEFTGYETNAQLAANEWHKAEGRTTDSANAVGWIMQEYCDAFSRGAENRVRQRLAQALLASNGVLGNATVVTPANEARLSEKTKANKNGNAQVVIVKQGGKKVALELNGVRGEAVARALTGRDMKEMPSWVKKTLRIWASTATEWSPTFALRNFFADFADIALLNIGDHGIVKGLARDAGHLKAVAKLTGDIRRYVKTGKTSNALLNEAIGAGILIGGMGREGFTDPNEAHAFFQDRMQLYGEEGLKRAARRGVMGAKKVAKFLFGWVETLNKTAELANRLADYKKSRDMGMSARDAAAHARDITVDFNEKGEWTGVSNALYMFSNSTMGAAFRQVKAVTGKHWKGLVGTTLAIGFAEGLMEAMNGDEDDADKAGTGTGKDVNEYTRANSLYLRFGKTTVRTPFHAGPLSVIKYTGNCAARYMAGKLNFWRFGDKNKSAIKGSEAAANIGKEAAGIITHFLGLGDAGPNVMQTITPSVLQWLVQLGQNRDYADRPIAKPKFDEAMPSSENGRRSTAEGYKDIARLLNEWSGGNAGRKGSVDYAPEQYKVVAEAVGKNVLRDVTSTAQTIGYVIDLFRGNADIDTRNIPVVRDFVRVNHSGNTQRYYDAATDYREDRYELQKMVAQWTPEERKAYVQAHPWARNPEVNKAIQKIGELQKYEDGFVKNGRGWVKRKEPPTEEQKAKWRAARLRYQARFLEYAEKHGGVH